MGSSYCQTFNFVLIYYVLLVMVMVEVGYSSAGKCLEVTMHRKHCVLGLSYVRNSAGMSVPHAWLRC
jgi:hypothetical protein